MDVMVDCDYPDTDEAFRLRVMLRVDHAWCHAFYLWSWALKAGREDGKFEGDAKRVAVIARFDGDPELLLKAFLECNVLRREGDKFYIVGWSRNKRYFKERNRLRRYAQARKAERENRIDQNRDAAATRAARVQHAIVTGDPSSSSSSTPTTTPPRSESEDLSAGSPSVNTARPAKRSASEPSPVAQVRALWMQCYRTKTGKECPWGAKEGGQAKTLLGSWSLQEVLDLIPMYFAWRNHKVIDAYWPFGTGPDCFILKIHALKGDTNDPERRKLAGSLRVQDRRADTASHNDDALDRYLAEKEAKKHGG